MRHKEKVTYESILLASDEKEEELLLRRYVAENPTDIAAYVRLGDILRKREMYDEAIRIHRSLIRPTMDKATRIRVGQSIIKDLLCAKRWDKSLPYLLEIVTLSPKDTHYLELLSAVHEQLGHWEDALKIRKRLPDRKVFACVYASYGKELLEQGERKKALQSLNTALKIDRFSPLALLCMGDIRYEDGKLDGAMELWRAIIQNRPEFAFLTYDRLENAYFEKKRYRDMIEVYESCIGAGENLEASKRVAKLYLKLGEREKALDILLELYESCGGKMIASQLADSYSKERDYRKAYEIIRPLIETKESYRCSDCNHISDLFYFRCNRCLHWMTMKRTPL